MENFIFSAVTVSNKTFDSSSPIKFNNLHKKNTADKSTLVKLTYKIEN